MGWKVSDGGSLHTRQALPDLRFTVERIFGEADRVMAYVRGRATHKGELKGVSATGTEIEWTVTTFVRLADGKIVECWAIADTLGILQRLGANPAARSRRTASPAEEGEVAMSTDDNKRIVRRFYDEVMGQGRRCPRRGHGRKLRRPRRGPVR